MLESGFKTRTAPKREFKLIPDGFYQVALEDIVPVDDLFKGEHQLKLRLQWRILDEGELQGERLFLKVTPTVSNFNNNPSWLFQVIKELSGAEPTEADQAEGGVDGDQLNKLIGKQAIVMVKTNKSTNGQTYSNIKGLTKAKALLPLPELKTKPPIATPVIATKAEVDGPSDGDIPVIPEDESEMEQKQAKDVNLPS